MDAPDVYGSRKTLYNRYVRWAAKGVWVDLFQTLSRGGGPPAHLLIDSSAVKAHRSASGAKGGSTRRPLVDRAAGARPRSTQDPRADHRFCRPLAFMLTGGLVADCTAGRLLLERMPACRILHADKGYDRRHSSPGGGHRCDAQHPAQSQPALEKLLLACSLSKPQRDRAHVLSPHAPSGVSRPATTGSPPTTSRPSASPRPSATGYESGP